MIDEPIVTLKDNKLFLQYPIGESIVIGTEELPTYLREEEELGQVAYERLIISSKYGIDFLNDLIVGICEADENGEPRENGNFIRIVALTTDNKTKTVYIDKVMKENQNYSCDSEITSEAKKKHPIIGNYLLCFTPFEVELKGPIEKIDYHPNMEVGLTFSSHITEILYPNEAIDALVKGEIVHNDCDGQNWAVLTGAFPTNISEADIKALATHNVLEMLWPNIRYKFLKLSYKEKPMPITEQWLSGEFVKIDSWGETPCILRLYDYITLAKNGNVKDNRILLIDNPETVEKEEICNVEAKDEKYIKVGNEKPLSGIKLAEALESKIYGRDVWIAKVYPEGLITKMYYIEEISTTENGIAINCDEYVIEITEKEALQLFKDERLGLWKLIEYPRHLQEVATKDTNVAQWVHKYAKIVFVEKVHLESKRVKRDLRALYPSIASVYGLVIRENSEAIAIAPMYSPSGIFTQETVEDVLIIPRGSIKFISEIKCECWCDNYGVEWG